MNRMIQRAISGNGPKRVQANVECHFGPVEPPLPQIADQLGSEVQAGRRRRG
jgi:hypothetical protein